MDEDRKSRLVDLGADALADALLKLAAQDDMADELVERIIATPPEKLKRVKAKLAGLKRMRRFIPWDEAPTLARQLEGLLEDLKTVIEDPRVGSELVASFYETDGKIFESCDDSSGHVGDVFRFDAKRLFVFYASRCDDKQWLGQLVLKLNMKDDYGVRDNLIDCAAEYLPEPVVRTLISQLQDLALKESNDSQRRHPLRLIESLARQLKDAPLFEKTRLASWGKLSTAACLDIAHAYLESDDAQTALSWLQKVPPGERSLRWPERDQLLFDISERLGNKEELTIVAWRMFRTHRSSNSLAKLLEVIGKDRREQVIAGEVEIILNRADLSLPDVAFLVEMRQMAEAEWYLLERTEQINGDLYDHLLPLAEALEADGRQLVATVLYRALLDSILRRAQTKTYSHGVRYLKRLGLIADSISNWRNVLPHPIFMEMLRQAHGRKTSFWSRYDK